jgi:hypothetical protein
MTSTSDAMIRIGKIPLLACTSPNHGASIAIRLGVIFRVAFLIGCATAGTHFELRDVDRLRPGMSEHEVVAILGRPYQVTTDAGGIDTLTWSWARVNAFTGTRSRAVTLRFPRRQVAGLSRAHRSR